MSTNRSESEIVHDAVDALLLVVAKSADDLKAFHDTVARLRIDLPAPFPRVAVGTTQSIIDHLKKVEEELQEVLVALGVAHNTDRQGT
jgi:hypothetical protein